DDDEEEKEENNQEKEDQVDCSFEAVENVLGEWQIPHCEVTFCKKIVDGGETGHHIFAGKWHGDVVIHSKSTAGAGALGETFIGGQNVYIRNRGENFFVGTDGQSNKRFRLYSGNTGDYFDILTVTGDTRLIQNNGSISVQGSPIYLDKGSGTNGNTRVRFSATQYVQTLTETDKASIHYENTGNYPLSITGDGAITLEPANTYALNLKSANNGGAINVGHSGMTSDINVGHASMSGNVNINAANWVEFGSWTPVLAPNTSGSFTLTSQVGRYQRMGKMVFFNFYVAYSAKVSPSGSMQVTGLPITSENTTNVKGNVVLDEADCFITNTADSTVYGIINPNGTVIDLKHMTQAGTTGAINNVGHGKMSSSGSLYG
ncbi:MAG: hypothetical protein MI921_24940, partial [Cytophagales bacterium]|nr:hypothetical protein [Cytophagales bacterium]